MELNAYLELLPVSHSTIKVMTSGYVVKHKTVLMEESSNINEFPILESVRHLLRKSKFLLTEAVHLNRRGNRFSLL